MAYELLGVCSYLFEVRQDDTVRTTPILEYPSRPANHNAFDSGEPVRSSESHLTFHNDTASPGGLRLSRNAQNVVGLQKRASQTFASVLASSVSKNKTPDAHQVGTASSPSLPNAGVQLGINDHQIDNGSHSPSGATSDRVDSTDLLAALSHMKLSGTNAVDANDMSHSNRNREIEAQQNFFLDLRSSQSHVKQCSFPKDLESRHSSVSSISKSAISSYLDSSNSNIGSADFNNTVMRSSAPVELHRSPVSSNSYHHQKAATTNAAVPSYGLNGYSTNPVLSPMLANHIGTGNLPPLFENAAAASAIAALGVDSGVLGSLNVSTGLHNPTRIGNHSAAALQMHLAHIQYLKTAEAQAAANFVDPSIERGYMGGAYLDLLGMQEAYLGGLLQQQKQYGAPFLNKSGPASPGGYYGNPAFGLNMSFPGSPLAKSIPSSPFGAASPVRLAERNLRFHSDVNSYAGGFPSSLLEEFKSSKARSFELSDIAGNVVKFSADQYGSRFIQQKLETATTEEKDMVFEEIMPQALSLMTDVFGNYVIQKFFEHGSASQIRELANQLSGHVLALSLQMYGCRVIQKALEVINLDQQTKMVAELDGHIMRCVRDQNGNHVIQKCIECIPEDAIHFIISSFYDHVVTLSTHPYGCRVIQRVLEHCHDPETQKIVMNEIMQCVCLLAQDQYGNYVVQHVLEHGEPHERSEIIKQLAGQIVQMSQQKFASNVVEKCLTFGGPVERQILVNEMLGTTDENEPLQAMMKDQFANYVVQKVLETCNDQQRELILSRIKVHLNALKKYTYGKHIVARVEKLVAAGERRIGLQPSYPY
ncbi:uncharacterized protein A4U43_C02F1120 [Asparagus officinalis]|uniref:PUM-HD domain-containing protein n=1 Tax=Asparagus officinalis TaxID=4686 RepID=A0A5P1FEV8_ASPOF|nr:uncharacterized protein A4U43_C02F1120 [Asparagus officinalis]